MKAPTSLRPVLLQSVLWATLATLEGSSTRAETPDPERPQIHVQAYQIVMPEAFRDELYRHRSAQDRAKTEVRIAGKSPAPPLDTTDQSASRSRRSSPLTTMSLDAEFAQSIVDMTKQGRATFAWTPAVILIDGDTATINETTNRPFVIDIATDKRGVPQPSVGTVATGSELSCLAKYDASNQNIRLTLRWHRDQITGVRQETYHFPGHENLEIQVPEVRSDSAQVTRTLAVGQWLWVDPHLQETVDKPDRKKWHERLATMQLANLRMGGAKKDADAAKQYTVLLLRTKRVQ